MIEEDSKAVRTKLVCQSKSALLSQICLLPFLSIMPAYICQRTMTKGTYQNWHMRKDMERRTWETESVPDISMLQSRRRSATVWWNLLSAPKRCKIILATPRETHFVNSHTQKKSAAFHRTLFLFMKIFGLSLLFIRTFRSTCPPGSCSFCRIV